MQTVLNKALRFIHQNEEIRLNSEELHIKYNINPLNISIHKKARNTWENVKNTEPELYENLIIPQNTPHYMVPKNNRRDSYRDRSGRGNYYLTQVFLV